MRANEFITESSRFDSDIAVILKKKGYQLLGVGMDQQAYLEPDTGLVIKIFGTHGRHAGGMSKAQRSFQDFAAYCKANANNPFLPNIIDWGSFVFKRQLYFQIRMERLFEASDENWIDELEVMAVEIEDGVSFKTYINKRLRLSPRFSSFGIANFNQAILHLGRDGMVLLWKTMYDLNQIAKRKDYMFDLHAANFMFGSDGHIVINDPFFT